MKTVILGWNRRRRGFTLIELMIVLAIVAVTASYAIPAYQDYIARSRVGEGVALAAVARMSVAENALAGVSLDSGYKTPGATANVASVAIDAANGQISISYTPRVSAAPANVLVWVPSQLAADGTKTALRMGSVSADVLAWECFAADKAASSSAGPLPSSPASLPARLTMADCRA